MHTMHPTLLIGPADWDAQRLPRAEFEVRINALWCDAPQAGGAVVYGDARDHAALAYLTHFTPKLEAAVALIPRAGDARLLVGGGINMLPAAQPLTWIENLLPLRSLGKSVTEWARGLGEQPILIGGDAMPYAMHGEIAKAFGSDTALQDGIGIVHKRMRCKSARELSAVRESCAILADAVAALTEANASGESVTAAIIAAEHAAYRRGAQDVRSLFSLDGGSTLRPFDRPVEQAVDPLQAYLAVRHAGYWAEGFVVLRRQPHTARDAARKALQAGITRVAPGTKRSESTAAIARALQGRRRHPVSLPSAVSIGLALEETVPDDEPLAAGEVISLRAGMADPESGSAVVSAMIAVGERGHEILWSAL
jgi:Xaa-Pro aminopeptidase